MYVSWTTHLTDEKEKESFKGQIHRARHVLARLKDLIDLELKSIDDTERDPKAYDNAGWPYKQAYKNGMRHGLSIMKQLVDLDNQKNVR